MASPYFWAFASPGCASCPINLTSKRRAVKFDFVITPNSSPSRSKSISGQNAVASILSAARPTSSFGQNTKNRLPCLIVGVKSTVRISSTAIVTPHLSSAPSNVEPSVRTTVCPFSKSTIGLILPPFASGVTSKWQLMPNEGHSDFILEGILT